MKRVKNYLKCIYNASKDWDNGIDNATRFLADGDKSLLIEMMEYHTKRLRTLDVRDVKDAILEHQAEIAFRLKLIDGYKIWPTMDYIFFSADKKANFNDAEANDAINTCHDWILRKCREFITAYQDCEQIIKPKNPIVVKALDDPILLSYFYDNKKVLEQYINFCIGANTIQMMAWRAKELGDTKIKVQFIKKPLHDALEKIGLDVGNWRTWNQHINSF